MILWWNETGEILACHQNRGGFEVAPPAFAGSMEIPDTLGDVVGAAPRFHRVAEGIVEVTENEGQTWTAAVVPPAPVPAEVSPLQATLALQAFGFLEGVEAAVAAGGQLAQLAWQRATVFRRDSQLLVEIAAEVPGLADQLDDIFRAAAQIVV